MALSKVPGARFNLAKMEDAAEAPEVLFLVNVKCYWRFCLWRQWTFPPCNLDGMPESPFFRECCFKRPIEGCVTFFPKSSFAHTMSTVRASSFGETRPASGLRILLRYDRSYPVPIPDPCIGCLVQGASAAVIGEVFSMRIREVLTCPKCGVFSPEVPTTYEANVFYAHMSALQETRKKDPVRSFDVALMVSLLSSSYSI